MGDTLLKTRMARGDTLAGTFMKTPSHDMVEVLAMSGLDFICLDAEHSSIGRADMDACLAVGRALGFPVLVRIPDGTQAEILKALDAGAVGVVVPHVASVEKARNIAKWAHFGHGGRGFAGSTRWAGFATRSMSEILAQSADETIVIAQIEEPEGVDAIDEIAAVDGLDGLFVGPADLAVCLGKTDAADPAVREALGRVGDAAKRHAKTCMTFFPNMNDAAALKALGVSMYFVGSEQSFAMATAKNIAEDLHGSRTEKLKMMSDISADDLKVLTQWDTPTICNALEITTPERRGFGFTVQPFICLDPALPPICGFAKTAKIRAAQPASGTAAGDRLPYYEYVATEPHPSIIVIEDIDPLPGVGAFWGEVHTAVHKGLGASGTVTNGSIRDLPDSAPGFQALGGMVGPSHAFVHPVDFNCPVTVHGMEVDDGDIIHADQHGAVVVPRDAVLAIPAAVGLISRREAKILAAATADDFDIEKLKNALGAAQEIH